MPLTVRDSAGITVQPGDQLTGRDGIDPVAQSADIRFPDSPALTPYAFEAIMPALPYRQQLVPGGPVVPVRYANTRAVAAWAATRLAVGEYVAIWPSDNDRALRVDSDPDASRIEDRRSDRSDDDTITVDLETWIHANTRAYPPGHLAGAREWIADCQWADDTSDLTDAQVIAGINQHYDGGWPQFIADGGIVAQHRAEADGNTDTGR
jgi:hypothetical protein